MTRQTWNLVVLSVGFLATAVAHGQAHRCSINGITTYSDMPCGTDSKPVSISPAMGRGNAGATRINAEIEALKPSATYACDLVADSQGIKNLHVAVERFSETLDVAQSTPRVGVGAALLQLSNQQADIKAVSVASPCAQNLKANALKFSESALAGMKMFAAGDNLLHLRMQTDASIAKTQYNRGRSLYLPK